MMARVTGPPDERALALLFVVHGFPPDTWAGTEVYTLDLARALASRGHRVTIVARAPAREGEPDWTVREDELAGLRVLRVARRVEGLPLGESYRPRGARALFERLLEQERPDVVHFQHLLHLSVDWIDAARARGCATVWTANDYWALCARVQLQRADGVRCERNQGMGCFPCLKDKSTALVTPARMLGPLAHPLVSALAAVAPHGGRLERFTTSWSDLRERQEHVLARFAQVDVVLAPSRFLRETLLESGAFDRERVVHSDYGTRHDARRALEKTPSADGAVRFAFVGSLVPYKGVDVLVAAMNELAGRACSLAIHGEFKPDVDAHHARLRELARAGNVRFAGRFEPARLADLYREIDVLVVPSTWFENSPLVIHEAFLHRTPVVTSDIGGMRELVTHEVDGLHFHAGDAHDLARTLRRFVDDPALASALGERTPKLKTLDEDADEMVERYRALLDRRTRH